MDQAEGRFKEGLHPIEVTRPDGSKIVVEDVDELAYEGEGLFLYRAGKLVYGFGEWVTWNVAQTYEPWDGTKTQVMR